MESCANQWKTWSCTEQILKCACRCVHVTWWQHRLHLHTSYRSRKLWADTGTLQIARMVHEDHKKSCRHGLLSKVLGENMVHSYVQSWCLEEYRKTKEADSPRLWSFSSPAVEWRLSVSEPSGLFHPPPCWPPVHNQMSSVQAIKPHSPIEHDSTLLFF